MLGNLERLRRKCRKNHQPGEFVPVRWVCLKGRGMAAMDVLTALNVVPVRPVAQPENRAVEGPASSIPEQESPRSAERSNRSNFRSKLSDSLRGSSRRDAPAERPDPSPPSESRTQAASRKAPVNEPEDSEPAEDSEEVEADSIPADATAEETTESQAPAVEPQIDLAAAAEIVQAAAVQTPVAQTPNLNQNPTTANAPPPGLIQASQNWTQRSPQPKPAPAPVAQQKPLTIPEGLLPVEQGSSDTLPAQDVASQFDADIVQTTVEDVTGQLPENAVNVGDEPSLPPAEAAEPLAAVPEVEVQPIEPEQPLPPPVHADQTGPSHQFRVNPSQTSPVAARKTNVKVQAQPVVPVQVAAEQPVQTEDASQVEASQTSAEAQPVPQVVVESLYQNVAADETSYEDRFPVPVSTDDETGESQRPSQPIPQVAVRREAIAPRIASNTPVAVVEEEAPPSINPDIPVDFLSTGSEPAPHSTPVADGQLPKVQAAPVPPFASRPPSLPPANTFGANLTTDVGTPEVESTGTLKLQTTAEVSGQTPNTLTEPEFVTTPVTNAGPLPTEGKIDRLRHPGESRVAIDPRQVVHQVARSVQSAAEGGSPSLRVRLDPPELGPLQIDVTVTSGGVSARLEAESNATQRLLQDNLGQLREALAQQGVAIDKLTIEKHSDPGRSDLADRSFQQQQQQQQTGDREAGRQQQRQPQGRDQGPFERNQPPSTARSGGSARNGRLDVQV